MLVTIVRFKRAEPATDDVARAAVIADFTSDASLQLQVPGLLWKAYLFSEDGMTVGGTYWWRDRASAEAALDARWLAEVSDVHGQTPDIEWFEAPVVVDGLRGSIRVTAPPSGAAAADGNDG